MQLGNIPIIENTTFSEASYINPLNLLFNLFLTAFLSYLLGLIFIRFGKSISNKASLASSFPMLSITTMIIITVVKSSLALSLGLVGALSIVRFRTPIKEPEDLVYIFLSIAIGIGYGALQITATLLVFILISLVIWFIAGDKKDNLISDFNLVITSKDFKKLSNDQTNILNFLKTISLNLDIIKFEKNNDNSANLILKINFSDTNNYNKLASFLVENYPELNFSVYEHKILH